MLIASACEWRCSRNELSRGQRDCAIRESQDICLICSSAFPGAFNSRAYSKENMMTSRTLAHVGALVALAFLVAMPVAPASAASSTMDALDPDRDGTIDMAETLLAGGKVFQRLNPDNDGTLDARELAGRLNPARDPDGDGTIDAAEYSAIIMVRFKRANPDNDGTIDDRELHSPAGQALLRLIK
jgi:hypothetical protein